MRTGDVCLLFPCQFCTFCLFNFTPQTNSHRIYNWNNKKKLDTSWISSYQLFAHLITLQSLEPFLVAYSRNKNIYLYHIHSYSIYMLELQSKWAEKWRRFYKKQSFKGKRPVHLQKPSILFTDPWNILNTQSRLKGGGCMLYESMKIKKKDLYLLYKSYT